MADMAFITGLEEIIGQNSNDIFPHTLCSEKTNSLFNNNGVIAHTLANTPSMSSSSVGVNTNFDLVDYTDNGYTSFHSLQTDSIDIDDNSRVCTGSIGKIVSDNSMSVENVKSHRVRCAAPKSSPNMLPVSGHCGDHIIPRSKFLQLVKEVDDNLLLDDDVEESLLQQGDKMFDDIMSGALVLARHRHSSVIELKDVQLYLDKTSSTWMPGFGNQGMRSFRKPPATEAHKQRLQLIKKSFKKY